ncbi:UDP-N-acetylmuramoyl-L-alanyl-D-glutamate--2,6-diaminopimelate ligase [uncultured Rikenella sp.]|uniref:UDP-N-acetylmuramoyl-L-alanyl-D-glutamate--2, 6-diaminopimelate ligase n=1 Tax=uncultured Rikenella sp. TaxID=368003 RepID=UPI00263975B4|nr:UDP-N-acetylmuramoyl-L-alanyl-D-glutamate--2,6-diaminopimelate ligase [uncultured Rikenella sp.]
MKPNFQQLSTSRIVGPEPSEIRAVRFDSRAVAPGDLFVAVRGTVSDGHDYIAAAVERGASAVVCETLPQGELNPSVCYVLVEDSARALAELAGAFYGHPSRQLRLVGVTGTNGKTTVATLLYDLFTALGHRCGLISTVVYRVGDRRIDSTHTTPDPLTLNRLLAEMVEAGCDYCFMEVSSHSVVQQRIGGLQFAGGIFTNITHDHLDYHKTFAEYIRAKQAFFTRLPGEAFALTNIDDRNGEVMLQNASVGRRATYSLRNAADYQCRIVEELPDGMQLSLAGRDVWVQFIGRFNAYNLTAIYGAAVELGQDPAEVLRILSTLRPVSGRFEQIRSADGRLAIVDYAHTPDALQNVIDTINELRRPDAQLITVVGCGGNRDATKRPVMARVAADGSSRVILTSDNPRFEEPQAILDEMRGGLDAAQLSRTLTIVDRREAIRTAIALSRPGDVVLVAGKGHEPYQEIFGVRHHFDDREEVTAAFA